MYLIKRTGASSLLLVQIFVPLLIIFTAHGAIFRFPVSRQASEVPWKGYGYLLFDASATDYIHVESIVTIAAVGLERLAKLAGIPLDRSAFPVF